MEAYNPEGPNKCEVVNCKAGTYSFLCKKHTELAAGLSSITACRKCHSIIDVEPAEVKSIIWIEHCGNCDLLTKGKPDQNQTDAKT